LHGRIAVGVLLVQDLVVIIALTFLAGLGSAEALDPTQVARDLGFAFGGMALMLVGAAIFSKFILPRPFEWASRRPEMLLIWSLSLCFVFVTAAEFLGLSPEIGAFLAGMSLAQLHCAHELTRRVQSLMNFFIAVFFVTLGAQMQLAEVGDDLVPALLLSVFVLVGKPIVLMLVIPRLGYNAETSFKTGITLAQISEFSFILAAMGMASGLIGKNILAVIAIIGLSTIVVSSYGILYLDALHRVVAGTGILRLLRAPEAAATAPTVRRNGHIIVVGMNTMGRQIVKALAERGESVLAIDTDPKKLAELPGEIVIGNVEDIHVLEECHYESAKLLVSTLQIEDTNNLVAYYCQQADIPCAVHGFDTTVLDDLRALNVTFLIDSKQIGMAALTERIQSLGFTDSLQTG
jgi:Kef-type K+ transport system membrane component KefB